VAAASVHLVSPRRYFDQRGQVSSWSDRNPNQRKVDAENLVSVVRETKAFHLGRLVPTLEMNDQFQRHGHLNGARPEELFDVDDPKPTDLHIVADDLRAATHQNAVLALDFHHVVGDQSMAPGDELDGRLALADPALAENQDAQSLDVHQNAVQDLATGETLLVASPLPFSLGQEIRLVPYY